tara:strand:+ start:15532 stop:15726 length:195 start_codon:yes stop_codon:yes gene_type:complete
MAGYSDYGTNRAGDPELQPPQKKKTISAGEPKIFQFSSSNIHRFVSVLLAVLYTYYSAASIFGE